VETGDLVKQMLKRAGGILLAFSGAVIASGWLSAPHAQAAQETGMRPMRFAVVRANSSNCYPNCPEWISAEGDIVTDSATKLKKFLAKLGDRKLPILIRSFGGDLDAAFAMGRLIRDRQLNVAVGYTTFLCAPEDKTCAPAEDGSYLGTALNSWGECNSACPLVLAGGIRRVAGVAAHVGVHQITTTVIKEDVLYNTRTRIVKGKKVVEKKVVKRKQVGSYTTTKMSKRLRGELVGYLKEMGVSTDILVPIENTPAATVKRLYQPELIELGLVTGTDSADIFTDPSICKAKRVPANCRDVTPKSGSAAVKP
jgi:hypothetical protein